MLKLALEYLGLIFLANLGVLQLAAGYNRLRGISFFDKPAFTYLFAIITITPPLFIFFIWNSFNATGIIEGAQQTYLFFGGFLIATAFTLGISSMLRNKDGQKDTVPQQGLDALKNTTYYKAIRNIIREKKH